MYLVDTNVISEGRKKSKAPGLFDFGQIDLEFLAAQVLRGVLFLPGFGMDGVPAFNDGLNTRYFCSSSPT
jgi:hypothetical protein